MNPTQQANRDWSPSTPKKPFVAKGHDRQLQDAERNQTPVIVNLMNSDDPIAGVIVRRDKWTITVVEHDCVDQVIVYKHAIESIVIKAKKDTH